MEGTKTRGRLCFAETLLLRQDGTQKFISMGEGAVCTSTGTIDVTSFLSLHGKGGNPINSDTTTESDKVSITDGDLVTIVANGNSEGRFLTSRSPSAFMNMKLPVSELAMGWDGYASQARNGEYVFEFSIHLCPASVKASNNRSKSLNPAEILSNRIKSSGSSRQSKISRYFHRSLGLTIEETNFSDSEDDRSVSGAKHTNQRTMSRRLKRRGTKQLSLFEKVLRRKSKNNETSEVGNTMPEKHRSEMRPLVSETIKFGDVIFLESRSKPGFFLYSSRKSGKIVLSKTRKSRFVVVFPEFRHVVNLNLQNDNNKIAKTILRQDVNDQVLGYADDFLEHLRKLPKDLMLQIFTFMPKWVFTARRTCRQWKNVADKRIGRIRIYGHFDPIVTLSDKRALFALIANCTNLKEVYVRNCDALTDKDFRFLHAQGFENPRIEILAFGGCKNLGDMCLNYMSRLPNLRRLNLAVTQISDKGLIRLSESMPKLANLNLYGCMNITATGVERLIINLKSLRELNLRGTTAQKLFDDKK